MFQVPKAGESIRCLGFDVGAKYMGWAVVQTFAGIPQLEGYGLAGLEELPNDTFGTYRKRLIEYWLHTFPELVVEYSPDLFASETIPLVSNGGKFDNLQRVKGLLAITVCQALAYMDDKQWREIGANTAKKYVTNNDKATKVAVRNAVIKVFPELEPEKKTINPNVTDAIAVALTGARAHIE